MSPISIYIPGWLDPEHSFNKGAKMKIEVGKFYKGIRGEKTRIYSVDGASMWPIHGAILHGQINGIDVWSAESYNLTDVGQFSEWVEPLAPVKFREVPENG